MNGKIANPAQVASLRRYVLCEGAEKGLEVIECDNGCLRFLLNVNKACDVMQLYHKGQNMSFISKNGFTQRELPFGRRFEGGMLYTCGLDSVGEREGFEEHGNIHNAPSRILRAECTENGIVVESEVRDTEMGGKNLVFRRCITTSLGSDTLSVVDRLTNEGFREEAYCLLYHVNLGYPMLDEGARIEGAETSVLPRTPWAKAQMDTAFEVKAPTAGWEETCYYLTLPSPKASLVNPRIGKRFTVAYSGETLPEFLAWKCEASGDFAVGLEPATTKLDDLFAYSTIPAGQTVEFRLDLTVEEL